jgi:hypothetical protein
MPQCAVEIAEVYRSVTRPVCMEIARGLMKKWGMDTTDVRLNYLGDTESLPSTNSTLQKEQRPNRLTTDKTISITVDESYSPLGTPYVPLQRPEQPLVFCDDDLKVYMSPTYKRYKVSLEVNARFGDRVSAQIWRRDVSTKMTTFDEMDQYDVSYTINIPDVIVMALKEFHRMRENVSPINEDFGDWLDRCLDIRYNASTNNAGTRNVFQITETQVGVVGYYEFDADGIPPVETQDAGTSFTASFTYSFYYLRPENISFGYPLMIHNQMVAPEYIVKDEAYRVENYLRMTSRTDANLQYFRYNAGRTPAEVLAKGIPIPFYDDWMLYRELHGMQQVFRILVQVDLNDPTLVLNLGDLGEWEFGPDVLLYMTEHRQDLAKINRALIFLNMYKWGTMIGQDNLTVDQNLNVRTVTPMNPREIYHLTVSMPTEPCSIRQTAYQGLERAYVNQHRTAFGTCRQRGGLGWSAMFLNIIARNTAEMKDANR